MTLKELRIALAKMEIEGMDMDREISLVSEDGVIDKKAASIEFDDVSVWIEVEN